MTFKIEKYFSSAERLSGPGQNVYAVFSCVTIFFIPCFSLSCVFLLFYFVTVFCILLLPPRADTLDGTRRAERLGTGRPDGGRETRQRRDESVRGQRARRIPRGVRSGPDGLAPGYAEPGAAASATAAAAAARRDRLRARGMRGSLQVTLVRVLHFEALA